MKIHIPGFPVRVVDEPEAAVTEVTPPKAPSPFPSVAEAMALAEQRQILAYTRQPPAPTPLVTNPQPGDPTSTGQTPHSLNEKPEVEQ